MTFETASALFFKGNGTLFPMSFPPLRDGYLKIKTYSSKADIDAGNRTDLEDVPPVVEG